MMKRRFPSFLTLPGLLSGPLAVLLLVALAPGAQAVGQLSDSAAGRQVMVDYIVHFAHHLQWPIEVFSGADAPFRICVMGGEALLEPLAERLDRHRVKDRWVELESVNDGETMRARSCQIIVFGAMKRSELLEAVGALEFFPVLTVSDADRFVATGGMVEFAGSGANVALQLNKTMLERADLKIGSSLFRLSREVD
ncbi:YfiR family protein [Microbulbifer halophilus]|uniref:YfiR family protein n=1 Tax=Microbulbifer halophilus TaxID=453963 RepID=A0ABW5EEF9_9GAMM|nr:YfiR family protein [Microbulbifer halophilus]MCW8125788.1 YfiR family protein [Microbulbifer halophilus]